MANLGDMVVSIVGDTAGFNKSLTETQKKMIAFGVNTAAVTAAVTQTIKIITRAVKDFNDYGSAIFDASEKTGLSTDSLQEWKFIAEQTGTTLESVTGAVGMMTRGLTTNADTFAKLGIELKNADGTFRSTTDIFNDTIQTLSSMTDETERDQMAFKLLGRSAQSLIPILNAGTTEIQGMKDEARSLGLILDKETISNADKLGDSTDALRAAMLAAKNAIVNEMAPALIKLADGLKVTIEKTINAKREWEAYQNATKGISQTQAQLSDAIKGTAAETANLEGILANLEPGYEGTAESLRLQIDANKKLEASLRAKAKAMASDAEANRLGTAAAQAKAVADAKAKEIADAAAVLARERVAQNAIEIQQSEELAKLRADQYGDWIVQNATMTQGTAKAYEEKSDLEINWQGLQEIGLNSMLSGFEAIGAALVDGESGWKVFAKSGILAIASVLEALGAQLAAMAALNFFSIPPKIVKGAGAAAGAVAAYVAAGAVRASATQFAEGGIVMPSEGGTLAQIAEAGQPEAVIPLDRMGDFGGTTHLVVNLDSRPLLDKIFEATRNQTVLISAGAIV